MSPRDASPERVLVVGGEGMLGHKMFEVLNREFRASATFRAVEPAWHDSSVYRRIEDDRLFTNVDVTNFDSLARVIDKARPDVVLNCVGIVKQIKEAQDPLLSIELNALFPHKLARACRTAGARMIHFSTDCVFSGEKGGYTEDDPSDADDLYGRTKFLGEVAGEGCLTIRTSIIGRELSRHTGLIGWFLGNRGRTVKGFTRVIYTGFPTVSLARIVRDVIVDFPRLQGLYQVASAPISKYDLLDRLRAALKLDIAIEPDASVISDRSLRADKFVRDTGYAIPGWDALIADLAADIAQHPDSRTDHGSV